MRFTNRYTLILAGIALITGLIVNTLTIDAERSNRPLSMDEQLAQNDLTVTEATLSKDLLRPTFGEVNLVGVAQTNNCGTSEKGCFGDRGLTEEEFAIYTGQAPQVSLLVYETELPVTADQIQELKRLMNEMPYNLKQMKDVVTATVVDDGTQPLYSFDVSADIGNAQIRVVIRPY